MRTAPRCRGTPPAVGDPFGYTFVNETTGPEQHNLSARATAHPRPLVQLRQRLAPRGPHRHDPGHPAAVGDPFGYPFVDETTGLTEQHNLFRTFDGHIHALWFNFTSGWHHEDRGGD